MNHQLLHGLLLVAVLVLAGAFAINERRIAARSGRRPRTVLFVLCAAATAIAVVGGATLILASS